MGTESVDILPAEGTLVRAPLVAAKGPITHPAGETVVVVVQRFWESTTIKAYRNVVVAAAGAFALYVAVQIMTAGGVTGVDWKATRAAALNAGAVSGAMTFAAWMKRADNNPVK